MQKVALITGTGKGIGNAVARLLLSKNYFVFGYSRQNSIKHSHFIFNEIDLSNLKATQQLQFPKSNAKDILLINNAARIGEIIPIHLKKEKSIIKDYNLNIIAPTILCKKFISSYPNAEKMIMNVSSGAANNPVASWSTYCASKSALDMLTKVIAEENHEKLNVFSIRPGVIDTHMQKEIRDSEASSFPLHQKFVDFYINKDLFSANFVAIKLLEIIEKKEKFKQNILNLRDFT